MTVLRPQRAGIPVPNPSRWSAPYWEGCAIGELRFQRCDACGNVNPKPGWLCRRCGSRALTWERSAGRGRLYSWTVVWRPQRPVFEVPYAPAIVEIDEGPHVVSAVVGCEPEELTAGMALAVEFHPVSDTISLPYFRPSPG